MFNWFDLIYQRELECKFTGVPSLDIAPHRASIEDPEESPLKAAHSFCFGKHPYGLELAAATVLKLAQLC